MGLTTKYSLPWPAQAVDFLRDGATAIRLLAEKVEDVLLPPLLVTDGSGVTAWTAKVAEIGWDVTDSPDRKRGGWDSTGANDQLVIPSLGGYYLATASVRFGGKAEPDWYDLQIRTRAQGDAVGSGTVWAETRTEQPANSGSFTQLNIASVVRIPETTPETGLVVRVAYNGATAPPDVGAGVNKLRLFRLSTL